VLPDTPADGYTLLGNFDSFATVPFLYTNIQHGPRATSRRSR